MGIIISRRLALSIKFNTSHLNLYTRKKRWKWILFFLAVIIVIASLWYTNILVSEIAQDERNNIRIWADAIDQKAELVNYTDRFFDQIREEERKRMELLADVYRILPEIDQPGSTELFCQICFGKYHGSCYCY